MVKIAQIATCARIVRASIDDLSRASIDDLSRAQGTFLDCGDWLIFPVRIWILSRYAGLVDGGVFRLFHVDAADLDSALIPRAVWPPRVDYGYALDVKFTSEPKPYDNWPDIIKRIDSINIPRVPPWLQAECWYYVRSEPRALREITPHATDP